MNQVKRWLIEFKSEVIKASGQTVLIGLIIFCAYLLFYWGWFELYPRRFESLNIKLIACFLGLSLLTSSWWQAKYRSYFAIYWFLTLLITLPFYFMFSFLMNHADDMSSMALLSAIFLLILLVEFKVLIFLISMGFVLAFLAYGFFSPEIYINSEHIETFFVLSFIILAGSTVNYKKGLIEKKRLEGMSAAASMIAHELRTPLLSIKSGAKALQTHLPQLFKGYEEGLTQTTLKTPIRKHRHYQLKNTCQRVIKEVEYANNIIDILLMNASQGASMQYETFEVCSMHDCLKLTLARYPFNDKTQRDLISINGDFDFLGSTILIQHVLFNLLKNALYAIKTAGKGTIDIWCEQAEKKNVLHIKDSARGMTQGELKQVFNHFYSTKFMGTGIGLSFCKLVMSQLKGDISCHAVEGQFTQFTLTFPRLKL